MKIPRLSPTAYGVFLTIVAGFGGLLYGVDLGVIAGQDAVLECGLHSVGAAIVVFGDEVNLVPGNGSFEFVTV